MDDYEVLILKWRVLHNPELEKRELYTLKYEKKAPMEFEHWYSLFMDMFEPN